MASVGEPAAVVDPKFEWAENSGSYVLRLELPGFRKDDFRVQVDGAGRLTVRGSGATGQSSFNKVFQLPSAASLDGIAGRFEAGVLTLTVHKRASSSATAPTSIEEIRSKPPGVDKETRPKEEEVAKEDALNNKKKAMDDEATKKAEQQRKKQEEEASKSKQEQQKPASAQVEEEAKPKAPQSPAANKEEEMMPNAPQAPAAATPPPLEKPAPKPEAATGIDKAKAAVAPESLAERVRRHREEERAKAAAAAAEKEAKVEREKKAAAACVGSWKERAIGELKGLTNMKWAEGLTDMKWADGVAETVRKNKEAVAVGIAAFSLGFLVSQKFFRK